MERIWFVHDFVVGVLQPRGRNCTRPSKERKARPAAPRLRCAHPSIGRPLSPNAASVQPRSPPNRNPPPSGCLVSLPVRLLSHPCTIRQKTPRKPPVVTATRWSSPSLFLSCRSLTLPLHLPSTATARSDVWRLVGRWDCFVTAHWSAPRLSLLAPMYRTTPRRYATGAVHDADEPATAIEQKSPELVHLEQRLGPPLAQAKSTTMDASRSGVRFAQNPS